MYWLLFVEDNKEWTWLLDAPQAAVKEAYPTFTGHLMAIKCVRCCLRKEIESGLMWVLVERFLIFSSSVSQFTFPFPLKVQFDLLSISASCIHFSFKVHLIPRTSISSPLFVNSIQHRSLSFSAAVRSLRCFVFCWSHGVGLRVQLKLLFKELLN